jgi:hypothetical protein
MIDSQQDAEERRIARVIRNYLAHHPKAMDTLEGIAEWWIPREQIRANVTIIEKVLADLIHQGTVEAFGTGKEQRYRLRADAES